MKIKDVTFLTLLILVSLGWIAFIDASEPEGEVEPGGETNAQAALEYFHAVRNPAPSGATGQSPVPLAVQNAEADRVALGHGGANAMGKRGVRPHGIRG